MNSKPSGKRSGIELDNDPPKKIRQTPKPSRTQYDVVVYVDGQKFYCFKEKLAGHSGYFKRMFTAEFAEKNQTEIELDSLDPENFQLFLDFIKNVDSLTDENVREAMTVADYLEATSFETQCLDHFALRSAITLKDQFSLAEFCNSKNLMVQVCSTIKDASELHEVIPPNLNTMSKLAMEVALQRSFELHGYRKSPSPLAT